MWRTSSAALAIAALLGACASGGGGLFSPAGKESLDSAGAAAGGPAADPPAAGADNSGYRLGPGDQLRVNVFGEDQLSGEYAVDGSGVVSMPLLGQVHVGGLTLREVEARLAEDLDAHYLKDPSVSAQVLNFRPFYITGEVVQGGEFPYQDGISVLKAVAIAGGYTFRARERGIKINRGGETIVVRDPAREQVMPGDVITVPERFF